VLRLADRAGLEVELPGAQSAALTARRAPRRWCGARVDDELLTDAELLVSELTTNALAHGQGSSRCARAWTTTACSSRSSTTARDLSATCGARTSGRSAVGGLASSTTSPAAGACVRAQRTSGLNSNTPGCGSRTRRMNTPVSAADDAEFLKRRGLHARGRAPDPASPCPALPPPDGDQAGSRSTPCASSSPGAGPPARPPMISSARIVGSLRSCCS
jgi:hypothetical protein